MLIDTVSRRYVDDYCFLECRVILTSMAYVFGQTAAVGGARGITVMFMSTGTAFLGHTDVLFYMHSEDYNYVKFT